MRSTVCDLSICYDVSGEGENVLFIHGWAGSKIHWDQAPRYLTGWKLWTLDLPGFGASDDLEKEHNLHEDVEVMKRVIRSFMNNQCIEKAFLVGHSVGGLVATQFAVSYPEMAMGLVLVEAPVGPELRDLNMPILLVFGDSESTTYGSKRSELAKEQMSFNPKCRLRYIKNAYHSPMLENPKEFYTITQDFFQSHYSG